MKKSAKSLVGIIIVMLVCCVFAINTFAAPESLGLNATYGDSLGDVALPEGYDWVNTDDTLVGEIGENKFIVIYTDENGETENVEVTVWVTAANFSDIVVGTSGKEIYTGKPIEPEIIVSFKGEKLKKGVDYTVTYENNIEIGSASATIEGIGNFKGKSVVYFNIVKTAVKDIVLSDYDVFLSPEETYQLTAEIYPENATNKKVSWSSTNSSVVTVDENGLITAMNCGYAYVVAEIDGLEAYCSVYIRVPVEGIKIVQDSITLDWRQSEALNVTITPDNAANQRVYWSSSDKEVAVVDENGVVTAVGKGTATITATTEDGAYSDVCTVSVEREWWQVILMFILELFGC